MRNKERQTSHKASKTCKTVYQEQRSCIMKRTAGFVFVSLVVVAATCVLCMQGMADEGVCRAAGKIETVDPARSTVAVEVLMGDTYCTIGGKICAGAVLKRGGEPVALADFSAGDQVLVEWRHSNKECIIEALEAN
jgi:hypothetical protein